MDNMIDHYQAVLRDLELRRSRCQSELTELENTINGIKKLLSTQASLFVASPQAAVSSSETITINTRNDHSRFTGMSVRWAILQFLSENPDIVSASTGAIAQALIEGGISSKGQNFNSNVSAVLSDMKSKRGEVFLADGQWRLTDIGRSAWAAIKTTPQYRNRISAAASTLQ